MESFRRSLVKTIVWRILGTIVTFIVVYAYTGEIEKSTTISIVSAVVLTVAYYINERIWDKIDWERRKPKNPRHSK